MAEVLVKFTEPVRGRDGASWEARACGDVAEDGLWQGWIEFISTGSGQGVRTARETEQPNRTDLEYWAQGLTMVYLEGALARALAGPAVEPLELVAAPPKFDGPLAGPASPRVMGARPALNPFLVFAEGEDLLRQQLKALSRDQLAAVVRWYNLPVDVELETSTPAAIADDIARAIRDGRRPRRAAEKARQVG